MCCALVDVVEGVAEAVLVERRLERIRDLHNLIKFHRFFSRRPKKHSYPDVIFSAVTKVYLEVLGGVW